MLKEQGKKARVFDFDDTIIEREEATRIMGLVSEIIRPHNIPNLSLEKIAQLNLNHGRVDGIVRGAKERIALVAHARRKVYPGVREELDRLATEGTDIYGNTGRSHRGPWVDVTEETLHRGGVLGYFKDIAFTPDGVKTAVSKVHRLAQLTQLYDEVEFDEDDPRTVRFVAERLPSVKINWIQYGATGLLVSRQEVEQFPNVRRVAVFGKKGRN